MGKLGKSIFYLVGGGGGVFTTLTLNFLGVHTPKPSANFQVSDL